MKCAATLGALVLLTSLGACRSEPSRPTLLAPSGTEAAHPAAPPATLGATPSAKARSTAPPATTTRVPPPASASMSDAWESPEACERLLGARHRPLESARLMSYNVRWFPDGKPGKKAADPGTDLRWLACAISLSGAGAVLLQEIKAHPRGLAKLEELQAALGTLTTSQWRFELDECPRNASQHMALLYNRSEVTLTHERTEGTINPHGRACQDQLRPGLAGYLKFRGGLDVHLLNLHLKSGTKRRDYNLRRKSVSALSDFKAHAERRASDQDMVVAGDFNAMGCQRCRPKISAEDERETLRRELDALGLRLMPSSLPCSEHYQGKGVLLDFFAVSHAMQEASHPVSEVSGYCALVGCARSPSGSGPPLAYQRLSDHCPVLLQLTDRDLD